MKNLDQPKQHFHAPTVLAFAVVMLMVAAAFGGGFAYGLSQLNSRQPAPVETVGEAPDFDITQTVSPDFPGYTIPEPPEGIAKQKKSAVPKPGPEETP